MFKQKNRIISLLLLISLIIPCYANAKDDGMLAVNTLTDEEQFELMLKQAPAMDAYEQLMEAWTDGLFTTYPEAFGGFYHTDDFKLAIKVVNNDEKFISDVLETISNPSVVQFVNTDVSINELIHLKRKICEEFSELGFGCGINQLSSKVRICIPKNIPITRQTITAINKLTNMDHVQIATEIEPLSMQSLTYYPGKMIFDHATTTNTTTGIGTLGWYGSYNFGNGLDTCFLTAGHVQVAFQREDASMFFGQTKVFDSYDYPDMYEHVYSNSNCKIVCGNNRTSNFWPKGNSFGDYAIMSCNSSSVANTDISQTNKLYIGTTTMTVTDYFGSEKESYIVNNLINPENEQSVNNNFEDLLPLGTRVAKGHGIGGITTAYGTVTDIYKNYPYDNYFDGTSYNYDATGSNGWIDGCVEITPFNSSLPFSISGDSGAPVYYVKGSSTVSLLGIISGGNSQNSYVTPTTILLYRGFIPYVG